MGRLLTYLVLGSTFFATLSKPWIGAMAAYVVVILGPQHIWWWNFEGIRLFFFVAATTTIGAFFGISRGLVDFSFLKTKINALLLLLFVSITLSHLFGAYIHGGPGPTHYDAAVVFDRIWKI